MSMNSPSIVQYTILFGFFARMNDRNSINRCLEEINERQLVLDLRAYTVLINYYIEQKNIKEVSRFIFCSFNSQLLGEKPCFSNESDLRQSRRIPLCQIGIFLHSLQYEGRFEGFDVLSHATQETKDACCILLRFSAECSCVCLHSV
jgi:hypothetical protein